MNIRKIAPLAAVVTMAASVSAGAAYNSSVQCQPWHHSTTVHCSTISSSQLEWLQEICKEYGIDCSWNSGCSKPAPVQPAEPDPEPTPDPAPVQPAEPDPEPTPDPVPVQPTEPDPEPTPDPVPVQPTEPDPEPTQNPNASLSSFASQVVNLVNQERAKAGLSAVTVDSKVQQAAQVRAAEQARSFSHTRPNGTSCFTALKEAGVNYRGAGENIAYGQTTPQAVMTAWMNSSGHRANILNAKYSKIGVGYTVINGVPYWAQMFTY